MERSRQINTTALEPREEEEDVEVWKKTGPVRHRPPPPPGKEENAGGGPKPERKQTHHQHHLQQTDGGGRTPKP